MNLFTKLQQRDADQNPIRIGMIGAGKFGSMFLAQANRLPGIHVVGIADLNPSNARSNLAYVGWSAEKYAATSLNDALKTGTSFVGDDWQAINGFAGSVIKFAHEPDKPVPTFDGPPVLRNTVDSVVVDVALTILACNIFVEPTMISADKSNTVPIGDLIVMTLADVAPADNVPE